MQEYLDNGLRLGWLIDPPVPADLGPKESVTLRVEVYRPLQAVEILESPATLSGEEVLAGFVLDLRPIFAV